MPGIHFLDETDLPSPAITPSPPCGGTNDCEFSPFFSPFTEFEQEEEEEEEEEEEAGDVVEAHDAEEDGDGSGGDREGRGAVPSTGHTKKWHKCVGISTK